MLLLLRIPIVASMFLSPLALVGMTMDVPPEWSIFAVGMTAVMLLGIAPLLKY